MSKQTIRMIASDIDGTLLRSDGTVSDYTVKVIHQAQKQGILFTVCSGRFPELSHVLLKNYGILCPVCGNNGATLWDADTDTLLMDHTIGQDAVRGIWQLTREQRLSCIIFGRRFVAASDEVVQKTARSRFAEQLQKDYGFEYFTGFEASEALLDKPINKFYFYELTEQQKAALAAIPNVAVTSSGERNIEIIPEGCSKGEGVAKMAQLFGIDLSQVMTVGDYENDVPMLTSAGLGVAMGNASDAVKARVKHVTDTNDHDGMAKAIEKYAL